MCLIAYAPKDKTQIPSDHLKNGHARNDDAWGIMFPHDGRLVLLRDTTGHSEFKNAWKGAPKRTPIAAHFRYGTSGAMTVDMAHPFPVLGDIDHPDLAVMHNGVLSCVAAEKGLSDTAVFIRDILQPALVDNPALVESEGWRKSIGATIGNPNKLLFMRRDGNVFFVNQHQGKDDVGGVWYSNTYSIEPPASVISSYGAWDSDSWYSGNRYTAGTNPAPSIHAKASSGLLYSNEYLDSLDGALPDLTELSETELYQWICDSTPEDITDAILDLTMGRYHS